MADPSGSTPQTDKTLEFSSGVQENNFLEPVQPFQSGKGLPYAPINWPNPGDTWGWKVGRRFNSFGYYTDRTLWLPRNLHKPSVPKLFASKLGVERYIKNEFPDADIDDFWASFSWQVPALKNSTGVEATPPSAVHATSASAEKVEESKEENPVATNRKRKHTAAKTVANQRTRRSLRQAVPASKDASRVNGNEEVTSNASRKDVKRTADFQDGQPDNGSFEQSDSDCMPEGFNNYLDSLVGNLATGNSRAQENELGQNQTLSDKEGERVIQQLQAEIDSNLSTIQEIDNQMTQLHCRRAELIRKNENQKRLIAKLAIDDRKLR